MENTRSVIIVISLIMVLGIIVNILLKLFVVDKYRKHKLALEPGGEKRLEIIMNSRWKKTQVLIDGMLVGSIPDRAAIISGQSFPCLGNSILKLQLVKHRLMIWLDGKPLPGPDNDTKLDIRVMNANAFIVVVGVFCVAYSGFFIILAFIMNQVINIALVLTFLYGAFFLFLGILGQRKLIMGTFLGTVLYVMDGVVGVLIYLSFGTVFLGNNISGLMKTLTFSFGVFYLLGFIVVHILILIPMISGCAAIITRKQKYDPPAAARAKASLLVFVVIGIIGSILAANALPKVLSVAANLSPQFIFPLSRSTPTSTIPTVSSASSICWTYNLTGFDGNRSQVWENVVDIGIKELVSFDNFKIDVVIQNPQLKTDGYVFLSQKSYLLPELCR